MHENMSFAKVQRDAIRGSKHGRSLMNRDCYPLGCSGFSPSCSENADLQACFSRLARYAANGPTFVRHSSPLCCVRVEVLSFFFLRERGAVLPIYNSWSFQPTVAIVSWPIWVWGYVNPKIAELGRSTFRRYLQDRLGLAFGGIFSFLLIVLSLPIL